MSMPNLLEYNYNQLENLMTTLGEPSFRAKQIWQRLWNKGCADFQSMTELKKSLRTYLSHNFYLSRPQIQSCLESTDGTVKFLLKLKEGLLIEAVLIPEDNYYTLCLSSQVGCPLACTFCSTGQMGFQRNLTSGEILSQILISQEFLQKRQDHFSLRNLVFMGMGEPLLNWPEVKKSLEIIRDPTGLNFSHRRVTLSTVGLPGKLEDFASTKIASLAVSLHAPDQDLRLRIMPRAAKMFPLGKLLETLRCIPLKNRQRIVIEYVLLKDINDHLKQAKDLNRILSRIPCKINLIAYNPGQDMPYSKPEQARILRFQNYLWEKGRTVTLRKSKGEDIQAACGQLKSNHLGQVDNSLAC